MALDDKIRKSIINQFTANKRKNLFYNQIDYKNHFQSDTIHAISDHKSELEQIDRLNLQDEWIDLMTEMALITFYDSNQFIDIRNKHKVELRGIYKVLWDEIIAEIKKDQSNYEAIQQSHLTRLSEWLSRSNSFIKEINKADNPEIVNVICSEYSALLQISILNINLPNIIEPLLDIGCGENAWLVKHLRNRGIDAYGLDRLSSNNSDYLFNSNWMEFDFEPMRWGTIVSNLSFALHFTNHNLRNDGDYIAYTNKYMEILKSLKINGCFYYAPSLPFIETYLPSDKYKVECRKVNENFSSSIVSKFK